MGSFPALPGSSIPQPSGGSNPININLGGFSNGGGSGLSQYLPVAGGLASALIGAWLSNRERGEKNSILDQLINEYLGLGQGAAGAALENNSAAAAAFQQMLASGGMSPEIASLLANTDATRAGFAESFGNNAIDPSLAPIIGALTGSQWDTTTATLNQILQQGGMTPDSRDLFNRTRAASPGMDRAWSMGEHLINQGGRNPLINTYSDRGQDVLNQGGFTPDLTNASAIAGNIAARGGRTAETQAAINPLLAALSTGGATPSTQRLENKAYEIVDSPSSLPLNLKMSMARDSAGRAIKNQAEAALRRMSARGGGSLFAGNNGMDQFAEAAAALEADAVRDTLTKHEESMARDKGLRTGALSGVESAINAANQRFNTATGGVADISRIEGDKVSSSLNALANLTGAATGRAGTFGNLGIDAENLALRAMGLGGDLINMAGNDSRARMGLGLDTLGLEQARLFGGTDGLTRALLGQASGFSNAGNLLTDNQRINLSRASGLSDAQLRALGLSGNTNELIMNNILRSAGGLNSTAGTSAGLAANMYGTIPGLVGGLNANNPWAQMLIQGGSATMSDPKLWERIFGRRGSSLPTSPAGGYEGGIG